MERCSIAPVARLTALVSLALVALVTQPSTCHRDDRGEERADPLPVPLAVTTQVTPTPLWAVVWGPTQGLEDETYHLLSSQETEHLRQQGSQLEADTPVASEAWPDPDAGTTRQEGALPESWDRDGVRDEGAAAEADFEEVDPQFYVTVTISSLLIVTAVIITAKLCYDRSCSRHPPPLSRGVAPPLSRALPCALASEESRQTLRSASFADRERIPVVNL